MRPRIGRPAPFQRNGINIENHGKEWQRISASNLFIGDIIAGHGLVEFMWKHQDSALIKFASGESQEFPVNDEVYAFTRKHG